MATRRSFSKAFKRQVVEQSLTGSVTQAQLARRFVRTTDSDHPYRVYPNLYRDRIITSLDQVWVADITYIHLPADFVYLAVILDACSRKVIGWALSRRIDADLACAALQGAITSRWPSPGCIHHSDRGVQYASKAYTDLLQEHQFQISMSRKGNPYDNARMESFFKTLKSEEVYLWEYRSFLRSERSDHRVYREGLQRGTVTLGAGLRQSDRV